jgi:predicted RNase H-like nuclease (RuvC/YqgF family)
MSRSYDEESLVRGHRSATYHLEDPNRETIAKLETKISDLCDNMDKIIGDLMKAQEEAKQNCRERLHWEKLCLEKDDQIEKLNMKLKAYHRQSSRLSRPPYMPSTYDEYSEPLSLCGRYDKLTWRERGERGGWENQRENKNAQYEIRRLEQKISELQDQNNDLADREEKHLKDLREMAAAREDLDKARDLCEHYKASYENVSKSVKESKGSTDCDTYGWDSILP